MLDAAKIAEELRYEQDNAQTLERERKEMEIRAHDLQVQLDDAEQVREGFYILSHKIDTFGVFVTVQPKSI